MRQTFTTSSLIMLDGIVAAVISNGSAFVDTVNGDQIYVPGRQIDMMNVDVGDHVRCWCFYNDPEHSHTAKYRSVRSMAILRLADTIASPKSAIAEALGEALKALEPVAQGEVAQTTEAPPATPFSQPPEPRRVEVLEGQNLIDLVDEVMDRPRILSAKDVHAIICTDRPEQWGDQKLLARINHILISMNSRDEIAAIKVYRGADQSSATAVLYSRSVELALQIMKGGR